MLTYILNRNQFNCLNGLAYINADMGHAMERGDEIPESAKNNILSLLREADALKIPLWLQNLPTKYYSNWRLLYTTDFYTFLTTKNDYNISIKG